LRFDLLDILWLDVLLMEFAVDFSAADVIRSELLAFVVSIEDVDVAGLGFGTRV